MRGDPVVTQLAQFESAAEARAALANNHSLDHLQDKTYLHLFKDSVQPLWEHPLNVLGGHFKVTAMSHLESEVMWASLVEQLLSRTFPNSHLVNGVSIMSNKVGDNLLKIWVSTFDKAVIRKFRRFLQLVLAERQRALVFLPHKLVVKGSSKQLPADLTVTFPFDPRSIQPQTVHDKKDGLSMNALMNGCAGSVPENFPQLFSNLLPGISHEEDIWTVGEHHSKITFSW